MDDLRSLDEETQRRLVLHAAKLTGEDIFRELSRSTPTMAELEKDWRENVVASVALCFLVVGFLFMPFVLIPRWQVRRRLETEWRRLLQEGNADCEHLVLLADLRKALKRLPRARRRERKEVQTEINALARRWKRLSETLALVEGRTSGSGDAAQAELAALAGRLEVESDPLVLESLHRQSAALQGVVEAEEGVAVWRRRLEATRAETLLSLRQLRSRLALLATTSLSAPEVFGETSRALRELNARLTATQEASEEVLQLRLS